MQNVRILADVVTVDNAVQEELSRVLLSGGALPMHLTSYSTTMHNLQLNFAANQSWAVTLSLQRPTMFGGRRTTTVPRTVRDGAFR
jgi:hypothetical protein